MFMQIRIFMRKVQRADREDTLVSPDVITPKESRELSTTLISLRFTLHFEKSIIGYRNAANVSDN